MWHAGYGVGGRGDREAVGGGADEEKARATLLPACWWCVLLSRPSFAVDVDAADVAVSLKLAVMRM